MATESEWALTCSSMVTSYGSEWCLSLGDPGRHHMDSEWRREENSKKKVLIIKRSKPERKKEQTLRLEAQSCEGREDGGCQAGAEPIKWE